MEPIREETEQKPPPAHFSLWDTICLIVGLIIGAGIFRTPGDVFALSGGPLRALGVWVAGGLLAIVGAFCFAELSTTYPRSGGEYVYLTRAFGSWAGFLFAWGQLLIIRTGASMVAVAYVFADFTMRLAKADTEGPYYSLIYTAMALLPIVVLTITNILGVRAGKLTQNTLTAAKVLGLGGVLAAGFFWARDPATYDQLVVYQGKVLAANSTDILLGNASAEDAQRFSIESATTIKIDGKDQPAASVVGLNAKILARPDQPTMATRIDATEHSPLGALSLALILVMWTYSGWHEGGYIAAEVRNPRRNLPLALLLATAAVIVLYLLVNVAYVVGLGYEGAAGSNEVAADVLALAPWEIGEQAICVLVIVSTLGGINGCIYTSARIFSEFGADHSLFAYLRKWSPRFGTPVVALLVQGLVSVATIILVACFFQSQDSFKAIVDGTAPVFWLFFLLTGVALFVLREKDKSINRPFTTPFYPWTPLIYCMICAVMVYGSVAGLLEGEMGGLVVGLNVLAVLTGLPLYWLSRNTSK